MAAYSGKSESRGDLAPQAAVRSEDWLPQPRPPHLVNQDVRALSRLLEELSLSAYSALGWPVPTVLSPQMKSVNLRSARAGLLDPCHKQLVPRPSLNSSTKTYLSLPKDQLPIPVLILPIRRGRVPRNLGWANLWTMP